MTKDECLQELKEIVEAIGRLPRFKGRSDFTRRVRAGIRHVQLYRNFSGDLILKQARRDLAEAKRLSDECNKGKELKE